jgi:hypothetical protein
MARGGLVLDSQISLMPPLPQKTAKLFKSRQKQLKNNHIASLIYELVTPSVSFNHLFLYKYLIII